ncbi:MAG: hypothetical protein AAFN11_03040 [Chloroflexota bacterium]
MPLAKRKRIDAPDDNLLHVEVHATSPQRLYSEVLEADFYELAREWQYGEDEHLQVATDALLEWAKAKNFVRK